jgi:uncharacterized membrane protein
MKQTASGKRTRSVLTDLLLTVLVNGCLPYLIYAMLKGNVPGVTALLLATLPSLAENGVRLLKHRKLDMFGMLMLATFVLAAAIALLGGSERMVLVRESFVTGAVGCCFLLSLLFGRPLIFHLAGRFVKNAGAALYEERWSFPYIRFVFRLMTGVWGVMLLTEAAVRIALAYRLTIPAFLAVSNFIFYGFIGAAAAWTYLYRKHAMRKFDREREASSRAA